MPHEIINEVDGHVVQKHDFESYIHDGTLRDLIIANWLIVNGVVKHGEDVTDLTISAPNDNGVRTIRFRTEPDIQVIYHK